MIAFTGIWIKQQQLQKRVRSVIYFPPGVKKSDFVPGRSDGPNSLSVKDS